MYVKAYLDLCSKSLGVVLFASWPVYLGAWPGGSWLPWRAVPCLLFACFWWDFCRKGPVLRFTCSPAQWAPPQLNGPVQYLVFGWNILLTGPYWPLGSRRKKKRHAANLCPLWGYPRLATLAFFCARPCLRMPEKVCESGCNLGPKFETQFWLQFWRPFFQITLIGLKRVPKLGPKPGPKIATNFANFFNIFRACSKSLPALGLPASCNFRIFLAHVLACVLRWLTTSSYLKGSLNGSHILRAFQVLKFGPPFSCNMLRARRRHAIDGEKTQGPRVEEAKMKTGQNPSVKEPTLWDWPAAGAIFKMSLAEPLLFACFW